LSMAGLEWVFIFKKSGDSADLHDIQTLKNFWKTPWKYVSIKPIMAMGALVAGLAVFSAVAGLTVVHVALMFIAMFWGINHVIGFFVSEPKPGIAVWGGKADRIAAWVGALSGLAFAAAVAALPVFVAGIPVLAVDFLSMGALWLFFTRPLEKKPWEFKADQFEGEQKPEDLLAAIQSDGFTVPTSGSAIEKLNTLLQDRNFSEAVANKVAKGEFQSPDDFVSKPNGLTREQIIKRRKH